MMTTKMMMATMSARCLDVNVNVDVDMAADPLSPLTPEVPHPAIHSGSANAFHVRFLWRALNSSSSFIVYSLDHLFFFLIPDLWTWTPWTPLNPPAPDPSTWHVSFLKFTIAAAVIVGEFATPTCLFAITLTLYQEIDHVSVSTHVPVTLRLRNVCSPPGGMWGLENCLWLRPRNPLCSSFWREQRRLVMGF